MLETIFQQLSIFSDLQPGQCDLLKHMFSLEACVENQMIFEQGDIADYLYIVVDGEVAIHFKRPPRS